LGIGRILVEFHLLGKLNLVNTVQGPKGIHNWDWTIKSNVI
jgi:hypothetical protein